MENRVILILKRELYDLFLSFIEDETESDESYLNLLNFIKKFTILKPLSEKCLKLFSQIGFNIYIHRFQFFSFFAKIIL